MAQRLITLIRYATHLLLTILALSMASIAECAETIQIRVLSYNIHHAAGVDGKLDLERIARVIRSADPDLVALQEVDRNVRRTQVVDQPEELARLTGLQVAFGANIELQGGHYGNALLSRFPIAEESNHLLPNFDGSEQRGVLATTINLPESDQSLVFLATHLDFRANERERLASAKAINDLAGRRADVAALLAGDMNAQPTSKTIDQIETMWTSVSKQPMATVPVNQPSRQIDFIFYRPKQRWLVKAVKILDEAIASDHRAIFAVLELQPGEG